MTEYKTGLFSCFSDCGACIYGTFCMGCLAAHNWAAIREETCSCFHCCCPVSPFWTRQDIRKKEGMSTAYVKDCLVVGFCMPCAVCQDARELKE